MKCGRIDNAGGDGSRSGCSLKGCSNKSPETQLVLNSETGYHLKLDDISLKLFAVLTLKSPDPPPWGAIITAVVLTTVGVGLFFIIVYKFSCHCKDLWGRHKDMADLDKLPVYPLTEIKGGMNKDYTGSDPLARDHMGGGGGGGGHRRDHSKDSLQVTSSLW